MDVVITHTDFRLYWPARINALNGLLSSSGHTLYIIEIAGKGSPYAFAGRTQGNLAPNWICLFPEREMESISGREASAALWNKLEEIQPDVVLAGAIAFPSGATAVHWCKTRGKKVVIFDNARLEDVPRSPLVNGIKRRIYRNVDAVLAPAPSHADAFGFWGVSQEKIFYGLNVVDNEWFTNQTRVCSEKKDSLQSELAVPDHFFLGVGRLIKKKNWVDVLLAYAKIRQSARTDIPALVLIGDGPEKENLIKIINNEPIEGVIFVPYVSQETLCKYYTLAAALILASSYGETWGLVVNEAMACGLPVIVSRQCGCAATLVHEGINGYAFDSGNRQELVQKLTRFNSLPADGKEKLGKQSQSMIKEWALDRFSQGAWAAINHSLNQPPSHPLLSDAVIMRCWKGRYRPV